MTNEKNHHDIPLNIYLLNKKNFTAKQSYLFHRLILFVYLAAFFINQNTSVWSYTGDSKSQLFKFPSMATTIIRTEEVPVYV